MLPFDKMPYTNFHELNLAYFIVHFREIFAEWETLYNNMVEWREQTNQSLELWKTDTLNAIEDYERDLTDAWDAWKAETALDITDWKNETLDALDAWKEAFQALFDSTFSDLSQIKTDAEAARDAAIAAQDRAEAAAATFVLDASLSSTTQPAQAKAVGDAINLLTTHKVAQPLDENNQPDNGTNGQLLRTNGDGSTEWVNVGQPTDAQTAEAINNWLAEHPEATTTVQDGSLTEQKFSENLKSKTIKDYITPQMYGAIGDGVTDDYISINACITAATNDNKTVIFPKVPSGYYVSSRIVIEGNIDILMESPIIANGDALIIGTVAQNVAGRNYILKARGNGTGTGIKLINVMTSNIFVAANNFENGVICVGDTKGFAYNKITLGLIYNCEYCLTLRGDNDSGWCNENLFINGRLGKARTTQITSTGVLVDSNYAYLNNNNIFVKTCVEACDRGFVFNYSRDSNVLFCRTESINPAFYFSSECINHIVLIGYGTGSTENYGVNNIVFTARGLTFTTTNNTLYDSGMLADYAFNNENEFVIGNYICSISADGTPIHPEFTRHEGYIIPRRTIGVIVSTRDCKNFRLSVMRNNNIGFRAALKLFDGENNEIIDGLQSNSIYGKFNYSPTGIAGNNPGFVTTANITGDVIFTVPNNCEKMFIGIRTTNSPQVMRINVLGTQKDFIYPSGVRQGISNAPTCYGAEGEVCYSAGANIGWRYHNGAWTSF